MGVTRVLLLHVRELMERGMSPVQISHSMAVPLDTVTAWVEMVKVMFV